MPDMLAFQIWIANLQFNMRWSVDSPIVQRNAYIRHWPVSYCSFSHVRIAFFVICHFNFHRTFNFSSVLSRGRSDVPVNKVSIWWSDWKFFLRIPPPKWGAWISQIIYFLFMLWKIMRRLCSLDYKIP